MTPIRLKTVRGYDFFEVASALQKAIRRADARLAGYWAIELFESNYRDYLWRRLLTISAEDCAGVITLEVEALYQGWRVANTHKKGSGRVFAAKAVILLASAPKSRDADHLTSLVYDAKAVDEAQLEADLEAVRGERLEVPPYAMDCHTQKGRRAGKTREDFFREEHAALSPRQAGLFDADVERLGKPGGAETKRGT